MPRSALMLTTGLAFAACGPTPDSTVTVFENATVLMMDADFSEAEAVAIDGDRVMAVGSRAEVMAAAGQGARVVDAGGLTIMPAFVDAHFHLILSSAATAVFEDVGITRFRTMPEVLAHMEEQGAGATADDWLLFRDADLSTQPFERDALTLEHLDRVSTEAPVVVWHAGGHRMTVNSRMLEIMEVTAETPNPPGSEFGRFADGSADGNVAGSAALFAALTPIEPFMTADRNTTARQVAADFSAKGLGTVGVAGVTSTSDLDLFFEFGADHAFPLRTRIYLQHGLLPTWDEAGVLPGQGDARARIIGYKISADGSNQAYTGNQREPYLGRPTTGLAYMTQEQIDQAIVEGTERGGQMAMHGNGDAGIDANIAGIAAARAQGLEPVRPRVEHCSIVQDDQIPQLIENDMSCSFLIAHVLYWGQAFRDVVFGPEKAALLDRTGSFERAGVPYTLHTDYSVSRLAPLEMVEVAVTRELFTDPGVVLAPDERASIQMALRAVTNVAAWQLLSEDEIGSLEAGKLADLVILADDPRAVSPSSIGEIEVLETWLGGVRVH